MSALRLHNGARDDVLVEGDRVVARVVGPVEEIDLQGACVLPGFNDAHVHFPTWAVGREQLRLEGTRTIEEALDRIAVAAAALPSGRWLRGLGWRAGDWDPPVEPDRHMLDRVAPGVPVALMARDYHTLWVSSEALASAGRSDGDGILRETEAWDFRNRWAAPSREEYLDAMRIGVQVAASRGVTAIHDKDGWLEAGSLFAALEGEDQGARLGRRRDQRWASPPLPLRVRQSVPADRMDSQPGDYVKTFMDGTVGSGTALLESGGGVSITSGAELEEIIRRATERRLPVAVHAIGDRANREALDAFAATRDQWAPLGLRQRIEHAQLLAPADVGRFAAIGVAASVQFSHAPADRDLADREWAGMTERAYAYRSLLDAGAVVANGSDAPVEELDPIAGIAAGVTRTRDGRPGWHPEQCVTVAEAIHASTVTPAWLAGDEHERGRLAPGMLADLVLVDRDPLSVDPEELSGLRVVGTMLGGRWTYQSGGQAT